MGLSMEFIFVNFHQLSWNQGKLILILIKGGKWVMCGKELRHQFFLETKAKKKLKIIIWQRRNGSIDRSNA
jgi:ABC-type cobalamin transport system permease subunit